MENHKGTVTEKRGGETLARPAFAEAASRRQAKRLQRTKTRRPGELHRVALSPCLRVILKARGNLTTWRRANKINQL
jgi:hypothetical protein